MDAKTIAAMWFFGKGIGIIIVVVVVLKLLAKLVLSNKLTSVTTELPCPDELLQKRCLHMEDLMECLTNDERHVIRTEIGSCRNNVKGTCREWTDQTEELVRTRIKEALEKRGGAKK